MSTTFGVEIKDSEEPIEVAFRSNGMRFTNEIDNCVRKSSTRGIVTDLQETLQRALDELEYVDTEIEYETVFDDE